MAGTKTWATNDVLTAADLNGYVRDQWITICTSGTRPSTSQDGRRIYETDTKSTAVWNQGGGVWEVVDGPWTAYTPSWTASGTAPALGNGSIAGRWRQAARKTIHFDIWGQFGTTSTYGTGTWRFSTPAGFTFPFNTLQIGSWISGPGPKVGASVIGSNAYVELAYTDAYVGPTTPYTWAATYSFYISMRGIETA